MLTEPPGEALHRTSTFSLPSERPGWIDLTTVTEETLDPSLLVSDADQPRRNEAAKADEGTPDQQLGSVNLPGHRLFTKAIYEIEGKRMTYCVAPPSQPRPTVFMTKKGDGYTLVSMKRQVVSSWWSNP